VVVLSQDGNDTEVNQVVHKFLRILNIVWLHHPPTLPLNELDPQRNREFFCAHNFYFVHRFVFSVMQAAVALYSDDDNVFAPDFYMYSLYTWQHFLSQPYYMQQLAGVNLWQFPERRMRNYRVEDSLKFLLQKDIYNYAVLTPRYMWRDFEECLSMCDWGWSVRLCLLE